MSGQIRAQQRHGRHVSACQARYGHSRVMVGVVGAVRMVGPPWSGRAADPLRASLPLPLPLPRGGSILDP